MATYFSSLYDNTTYRGGTLSLPRYPNVDHRGSNIADFATFTIPTGTVLGVGDVIKLVPGTPGGFRLTRFTFTTPGYDGGTALVYTLNWASQASGAGYITAQTGLRAAGTVSLTDAQILAGPAASGPVTVTTNLLQPGSNDELQIVVTTAAASAGTNGTTTFYFDGIYP